MGVGGQHHAPAALLLTKKPGTHFEGGWVGPRAGVDVCVNVSQREFDPQTVQPLASRYTDNAIPAHMNMCT